VTPIFTGLGKTNNILNWHSSVEHPIRFHNVCAKSLPSHSTVWGEIAISFGNARHELGEEFHEIIHKISRITVLVAQVDYLQHGLILRIQFPVLVHIIIKRNLNNN
jgi:hypothetical protein